MPAVMDDNWNSKAMRELADEEFKVRGELVKTARQYYLGNHRQQLVDKVDNVVVNLCKQVIDETAAFLAPDMPAIETDTTAGTSNADEVYLMDVWMRSGGARLINQLAVTGGTAGHVFVRVVMAGERVRFVNLDPHNIIKWWLADDHTITLGYELRWKTGAVEHRQDIIASEGGWAIRDYHKNKDDKDWTFVDESRWELPIAPIVDWQHLAPVGNGVYGQNEIPHYEMNNHINKVASDIKSILRYHAYPTTVGTGFTTKDVVETQVGGVLTIQNPDAKVYNVEMDSDLQSSMNMLNTLRESFISEARVVIVRGGLDSFRGMTNLGIRAAFMPMLAKTAQIRRSYEDGIVTLCRLVLMLAGKDTDDLHIRIVWGEALPVDRREELALIQQQMMMGVMSKRTAAVRLGLDYDDEVEDMEREAARENAMVNGVGENV